MSILKVDKLSKSFQTGFLKKRNVLEQVSFEVQTGAITGFIGSNGSGKTTTIKSILGFIFSDTNESQITFFNGQSLTSEVRKKIGYLPERPYLPEKLTTQEFLKFHWDLGQFSGSFQDKSKEVLARVDLKNVENRQLKTFSKGMLQRAGLAQALLGSPQLLILDEPMSGLDPDGRWLVKEIIREENRKGTSIFFSSHLLSDMDELCSQLVVIDQGRVIYSGLSAQFARGDEQTFSVTFFQDGTAIPKTETVEKSKLSARISEIQSSGGEIFRINPEQSGIEYAFAKLRHRSGDQSRGAL